MKRLAPLSLAFLILYNAFGYYALYAVEQDQAKTISLDQKGETAFKVLKIPVSAYIHLEDTEFEETQGQFLEDGVCYNLIKSRRVNDTLYVYAVYNERADRLTAQFNDYFKDGQMQGASGAQKSPVKQALKNFLKHYLPQPSEWTAGFAVNAQSSLFKFALIKKCRSAIAAGVPTPPPERAV